jgi:hypothetical protein
MGKPLPAAAQLHRPWDLLPPPLRSPLRSSSTAPEIVLRPTCSYWCWGRRRECIHLRTARSGWSTAAAPPSWDCPTRNLHRLPHALKRMVHHHQLELAFHHRQLPQGHPRCPLFCTSRTKGICQLEKSLHLQVILQPKSKVCDHNPPLLDALELLIHVCQGWFWFRLYK